MSTSVSIGVGITALRGSGLVLIGVSAALSGDTLTITGFTALPAPSALIAADTLTVTAFGTHPSPAVDLTGDTLTIERIA